MKFMKMVFVLCFIILPNIYGVSANCMPFKIGFEFQTCGGLCVWAKNNYNFQKRPIFYVEQDKKKIWHLEIDGTGLEFVTEPFSCKEKSPIGNRSQTNSRSYRVNKGEQWNTNYRFLI